MALTISQAGSATSTTSSSTLVVTPTVSFSQNDGVLVCIAADNSGTLGAISISSVSDSQSNTYTLHRSVKTQGGSINNLASAAIYLCAVTNAISTSDSITVNFSPNTPAKAVVIYRIVCASGKKPSVANSGSSSPVSAATSSSRSTVTISANDAVFMVAGIETNESVTTDTDTLRGSWSSAYSATADTGTLATSMQVVTQYKTVTSSGTQAWDLSWATSTDYCAAYATITEVAALSTVTKTATGSGTGTATAATKVTQLRLGIHTDFSFGFTNGAGRFYIGAPTIVRTATGSGTGAGSATKKIVAVRTATGTGTGTSNNAIVVGRLRTGYGSGGATAGDTATIFVIKVRTATGSGIGGSSVSYIELLPRTATGSGQGTATTTILRIVPRTASNTGTGTATSIEILVAIRTATGSGTGTAEVIGARITRRTGTATGLGAGTADWTKSHIFRVPYTETYPAGYFGGGDAANRLRRYDRSSIRTLNLYKLNDGTYTTIEQRDLGQVVKLWHGGRDHFLTDAEVVELTEAGFGASIS